MYHSEQLTTAALIQTYRYMIENGLEYSKLTIEEADVFFQLKEDKSYMFYYHFTESNIEAEV